MLVTTDRTRWLIEQKLNSIVDEVTIVEEVLFSFLYFAVTLEFCLICAVLSFG